MHHSAGWLLDLLTFSKFSTLFNLVNYIRDGFHYQNRMFLLDNEILWTRDKIIIRNYEGGIIQVGSSSNCNSIMMNNICITVVSELNLDCWIIRQRVHHEEVIHCWIYNKLFFGIFLYSLLLLVFWPIRGDRDHFTTTTITIPLHYACLVL